METKQPCPERGFSFFSLFPSLCKKFCLGREGKTKPKANSKCTIKVSQAPRKERGGWQPGPRARTRLALPASMPGGSAPCTRGTVALLLSPLFAVPGEAPGRERRVGSRGGRFLLALRPQGGQPRSTRVLWLRFSQSRLCSPQLKPGRKTSTVSCTPTTSGWSWRRNFTTAATSPSGGKRSWPPTWGCRRGRSVPRVALPTPATCGRDARGRDARSWDARGGMLSRCGPSRRWTAPGNHPPHSPLSPPRQVKIWFQNRRAKERKINKKKLQQAQPGGAEQLSPGAPLQAPAAGAAPAGLGPAAPQ